MVGYNCNRCHNCLDNNLAILRDVVGYNGIYRFTCFLLYLIVSLSSIVFWIRNRKKFNYPFAPLCINVIAIIVIICTPSIYSNKSYYKRTIALYKNKADGCDCNLNIETYCVYGGGAWGGDMNSLYLTDLVNFRKYIGTYDEEDGMITTNCKEDSVFIEKKERGVGASPLWDMLKLVDKKVLSLKELKRKHVLE